MTHLMPENVPEGDFTTITDINSIYDLFNEDKISLSELDRLKGDYYEWFHSPEQRTTVLRFYRQPDGTMTIYKQVYVQTYGESGNPDEPSILSGFTEEEIKDIKDIAEYLKNFYAGWEGREYSYDEILLQAKDEFLRRRHIREKSGGGNPAQYGTCYGDAWRFLIKKEEGFLIHGSIQLSAEGPRVNHAWVELPTGWVWEPQTRDYYTIEDFKISSPVEEHRYTVEEAAIMVARVGKHGPWSDEERIQWLRR